MTIAVNAPSPLVTPTYDGSGESVHPGVVDSHEVLGAGNSWQGHRYWMVHTPYFNSNDTLENPSILVSDNLVDWVVPAGLTNPVVQPDASWTNTDGDLMLEPDGSKIHIVWRQTYPAGTTGAVEHIRLVSSADGITWTAPLTLFTSGDDTTALLELSPSVVKIDDVYHLYTVNAFDKNSSSIGYRTATAIEGPYSAKTELEPGYYNGEYPWHISVRREAVGVLRFVMNVSPFAADRSRNGELWLAYSDGPGQHINALVKLLEGTPGGWDEELYRSCIVPGISKTWALIYSAYQITNADWHIGLTEFDYDLPSVREATSLTNASISGLPAGDYEVTVRARTAAGVGPWSATQTVSVGSGGNPPDTTPDAFTLTDLTDQPLSTLVESNAITVTGVTDATDIPISVTGGDYAVSTDGGATWGGWTSTATTVQFNDQVKVRHTTSAANSTSVNTTLTIGGVSDTFTTTTEAPTADTTAPVISIVSISTQDTTPIVSGTCDDATATLTLTLDGATYSPAATSQWTQQVNELAVGSHTATLTATDPAGNSSTATATITIQPTESTTTFAITGFGDGTAFPGETMVIACSGDIGETPGSVRLMDSDESTSVAQSVISWNVATAEITITVQQGNLPYGDGTQKVRVARADTLTQTFSGITLIPETGAAFRDLVNPGNGAGTAGALLDQVLTTGAQVSWRDINTLGIAIAADGTVSSAGYGAFYLRAWMPSTERWGSYKLVTLSEPAGTPVAPMIQSVGPIEGFPDIFPDSMDWELRFRDQVFTSDLNGIESSLELPGAKWAISMTFGQREGREGRRLAAFLASQKGKIGRFNVTPATFAPPAGTAEGQPLVRGPNQTGNTLVTDGWLANQPEALAIGDYFSVNGELKMVTDPVIVDANGLAIIHFAPNLHQAPPDNAEIRVTRPMVRVKLMSNARWMLNHPVLYGIKVDCMEALDV